MHKLRIRVPSWGLTVAGCLLPVAGCLLPVRCGLRVAG